ncbi:MAG: hypothetical protein K0V04_17565 [Deltaproteobacteria bacterium]|nr:hypothetical protein [Deltaproteobacteria bacterium]
MHASGPRATHPGAGRGGTSKRRSPRSKGGVVDEIAYGRYDIPGDAFGAIAAALVEEHGTPTHEDERHRAGAAGDLDISLRSEMQDAGLLTSLVVRRRIPVAATSPSALAEALEAVFDELEAVEFRPKSAGFEISADVVGYEDGILLSWPTNPMQEVGFASQFVDAVLAELRDLEQLRDDTD